MSQLSIGIAVITHTSKHHLPHCLPPLLNSPLKPRVLVVNSSSNDGTVEEAERLGAETLVIPRKEFNHGTTRERARQFLGTDIVVMMTPDAYASGPEMLGKLIAPIVEGSASISYARQIPHEGASFFEAFPRAFNYPEKGHVRGLKDRQKFGSYTFFCSDSCCAYLNSALDSIGGFPSVLIGEDTVVTALLLKLEHKISYTADAVVKHSHRYGLGQEFRRHFDTGLARKQMKLLLAIGGRDEKRGVHYVKALVGQLVKKHPHLLPYAFLQTFIKWFGYRLGRLCTRAPIWLRGALSGQGFYWVSKDFLNR